MQRHSAGALSLCLTLTTAIAQQPTIHRKALLTQDLPIPGYQTVMATVELPAGAREGRYKAGDSIYIEAGKIHEGINNGTSPVKAVATFVVEKGKPLASPAAP